MSSHPLIAEVLHVELPDAGFYLWAGVAHLGVSDTEFARGCSSNIM
jgi:N-succinyldiaminopimelate aminotransferase